MWFIRQSETALRIMGKYTFGTVTEQIYRNLVSAFPAMSRERKFSLVFWLEENQCSIVKTIDVVDSRHARVGDRTMVRWDGEVNSAEILEISGRQMV